MAAANRPILPILGFPRRDRKAHPLPAGQESLVLGRACREQAGEVAVVEVVRLPIRLTRGCLRRVLKVRR